jgi:hypothetical protein
LFERHRNHGVVLKVVRFVLARLRWNQWWGNIQPCIAIEPELRDFS